MQTFHPIRTLAQLEQYFDGLLAHDDTDAIFASAYIRGFIDLIKVELPEQNEQFITAHVIERVSTQLSQAKTELSPQDQTIVQNFWQATQANIVFA